MIHDIAFDDMVNITVNNSTVLTGQFSGPDHCKAAVILFYNGGSQGEMNKLVAEELHQAKFATLLLDLLTSAEIHDKAAHAFDVHVLAGRLMAATDWVSQNLYTKDLPVGFFGSSTEAAAAFYAATEMPGKISSIVCWNGRPDLASPVLDSVIIPVLLMVGKSRQDLMELNQKISDHLSAQSELINMEDGVYMSEEPEDQAVIPEIVIQETRKWFLNTL